MFQEGMTSQFGEAVDTCDMLPDNIGSEFVAQVSVQDYRPKTVIDGVRLIDLRTFNDDGGSFTELVRVTADGALGNLQGFHVAQCNYSEVLPGTVKAWHLHRTQDDLWFVPPSHRLLVGLLDVRRGSPTYDVSMRFTMGAGQAQLAYIPAGVAHGLANLWHAPASLLYFVTAPFNATAPDELRLPWDIRGATFWEMERG